MVFKIDFQAVIDFAARNTDPAIGPIAILDGAADGILKHSLKFNFFQYVKAGVPGFIAEENPPIPQAVPRYSPIPAESLQGTAYSWILEEKNNSGSPLKTSSRHSGKRGFFIFRKYS